MEAMPALELNAAEAYHLVGLFAIKVACADFLELKPCWSFFGGVPYFTRWHQLLGKAGVWGDGQGSKVRSYWSARSSLAGQAGFPS